MRTEKQSDTNHTRKGIGHCHEPACSKSLHFVGLAILACLFTSSPPELHGRFKCCPDSNSTSAILSTRLAKCCTSAIFTATAFPSHSPPFRFLCTSHISSLAFLPHLSFPPLIPICLPDYVVPISAHLLPWQRVWVSSTPPFASGGTVGIASFCTFQRVQIHSNLGFFYNLLTLVTCTSSGNPSTYQQQAQVSIHIVIVIVRAGTGHRTSLN
jgi:hypothetical protein